MGEWDYYLEDDVQMKEICDKYQQYVSKMF